MHSLPRGGAGVSVVRGEHRVVHFEQRIVVGEGFFFKHVQRRAAKDAVLQGLDERLLVYDGAARAVDQYGGGFHLCQGSSRDEVVTGGVQVHVYADVVGAGQRIVQGSHLDTVLGDEIRLNGADVVAQNIQRNTSFVEFWRRSQIFALGKGLLILQNSGVFYDSSTDCTTVTLV